MLWVTSRKKGLTSNQLKEHAPNTPHIYGVVVWLTQENFWCSIALILNIWNCHVLFVTTITKIYDFNRILSFTLKQYIFQLNITMYYILLFNVIQAFTNLPHNFSSPYSFNCFKGILIGCFLLYVIRQIWSKLVENYYDMIIVY